MPAVVKVMKDEATLVTLVKPQFEAHRSQVRKSHFIHKLTFILQSCYEGSFSCWKIA